MGSGVWVHSGVYTFPGVFYELAGGQNDLLSRAAVMYGVYPSWSLFFYT